MKKLNVKKILIPVDFSETATLALDHAVFMAKLRNAEITLLHVIETLMYTSAVDYSVVNIDFQNSIEQSAKEKINEIATKISEHFGIKVNTQVEIGRIYKEIIKVAEETDADVIVMGTHGVSGVTEFFIGSNAYRVACGAPCPVISVQIHSKKMGFKNIALPIDNSHASRQKVNHAIELARMYGAVIHIAGLVSAHDKEQQAHMKLKVKQVEDYISKHNISNTATNMYVDNLAIGAMEHASKVDADLIVIMTEQEPTIAGIFMGQYAQQLINHSKIPVMSIRPEDVKSDLLEAKI